MGQVPFLSINYVKALKETHSTDLTPTTTTSHLH